MKRLSRVVFVEPEFCPISLPDDYPGGDVVLVCGGRDYKARMAMWRTLDQAHAIHPIRILVHGDQRGADRMAGAWARARGVIEFPFPADWDTYEEEAGPIRNTQMLVEAQPDVVIAFPGGPGTKNMKAQAKWAGVKVSVA